MKRFIILFTMFFAGLQTAQAGGYQIPEMGAKAMGMGNAFTAVADDASAAWFNPAGVAFGHEGMQVMAGGVGIFAPGSKYAPNAATGSFAVLGFPAPAATRAESKTFFVPHAY
ncbi:MAG: long chain fatty acid transport protein, partial [Mariprofundus sp.]|nr:long chain fatty acid transport protein [Mariprofundus sp.]